MTGPVRTRGAFFFLGLFVGRFPLLEAIDARLGKSLPGKSHFLKLLSVVWVTHFGGQFAALGGAQSVVGDFEHIAVPPGAPSLSWP